MGQWDTSNQGFGKRGCICKTATMGHIQPELLGKHGRSSTCSLTDAKVAQIGLHEIDVKEGESCTGT